MPSAGAGAAGGVGMAGGGGSWEAQPGEEGGGTGHAPARPPDRRFRVDVSTFMSVWRRTGVWGEVCRGLREGGGGLCRSPGSPLCSCRITMSV